MAKTYTAPFAQTPQNATAVTTGACADFDGDTPTNTVLLLTAGSEGGLLTKLTAIPRDTVTASNLMLFISDDSGTTKRLINSALLSTQTVDTTTPMTKTEFSDYSETTPLRLEALNELYVGNAVAASSGVVFFAEFTNF